MPGARPKDNSVHRVLIVEDDELSSELLREHLEECGYRVAGQVEDGPAAIRFVENFRPDIVLMDIGLEGSMDGVKAAQEIRKIHAAIIIYTTGETEDEIVDRAALTDHSGYLLKPIDPKSLKISLSLALRRLESEKGKPGNRECFQGYCFDFGTLSLYRGDQAVQLGGNERRLLDLLIRNKNSTISYDYVRVQVWGSVETTSTQIRELIHRIRRKLPDLNFVTVTGQVGLMVEKTESRRK